MKRGPASAITKREADIRAYFDANNGLYVDRYAVPYKAVCYERLDSLETLLQARIAGPLTVLDVGCGASVFTDLLLERFPRASAYCLDTSFEMLKRNAPGPRKRLVQSDARVLPFSSRSFDLINLDTLMHHMIDFTGYQNTLHSIERFLVALRSLLKPNGVVIVREIYHEFRVRDDLGTHLIYLVSTLRLPSCFATTLSRLGLSTANVGVCFLTRRQWSGIFERAGYNVVCFNDKRWPKNPYRFLGFRCSGDLYYTLSPVGNQTVQ